MAQNAKRRWNTAIIVTVLNEESSVGALLESLVTQTRVPDEVIFVDGGSNDRTPEIIRSYAGRLPITLLIQPGVSISEGRNAAIRAAESPLIASTDAGVRLVPEWLETLTQPFETAAEGELPGVVCGFFLPDPHTAFEVAMGATVLPRAGEIVPEKFLPSSRSVAFLRSAWERWPYPQWLDYCEDLVFDLGLRQLGYRFEFRKEAVAWFRPRSNMKAFFKQYYRYARGDGKSDLWRKRHLARYGAYLVALPALLALITVHSPWWLVPLAGAGGLYVWRPYRRLVPDLARLSAAGKAQAIILVPMIRLVGDVAKMMGYPVGLWWRFRHRGEPALDWREAVVRERSATCD